MNCLLLPLVFSGRTPGMFVTSTLQFCQSFEPKGESWIHEGIIGSSPRDAPWMYRFTVYRKPRGASFGGLPEYGWVTPEPFCSAPWPDPARLYTRTTSGNLAARFKLTQIAMLIPYDRVDRMV